MNVSRNTCIALLTLITACTSPFPRTSTEETLPLVLMPATKVGISDERARFREIFCAILDERQDSLPDYRPCEETLTRVNKEPPGSGDPVDLGQSRTGLTALIVPGVGWDCFEEWMDTHDTMAGHVEQFGYRLSTLRVEGLSSSTRNAALIRDALLSDPALADTRNIVLIGYSKGANDSLEALVSYPEIRERIVAVISAAGSIGGSPLAEDAKQAHLSLITNWPGAECTAGDAGAIETLRPRVRQQWLRDNALPPGIAYYSLATLPEPARISTALSGSYNRLSLVDGRNDGQLLFYDQLIPGSGLLGYLNADHWAVAAPIARHHKFIGSTVADQNDFPREALFEALLRFVEEDLASKQADPSD